MLAILPILLTHLAACTYAHTTFTSSVHLVTSLTSTAKSITEIVSTDIETNAEQQRRGKRRTGERTRRRMEGNLFTLTFDLHDPDPLTNASTTCTGSWNSTADNSVGFSENTGHENAPLVGWTLCSDDSFAWRFASFKSIYDFELNARHHFEDSSVGAPPYNYVTTFSEGVFNQTANLDCETRLGEMKGIVCSMKRDILKVELNIYAAAA